MCLQVQDWSRGGSNRYYVVVFLILSFIHRLTTLIWMASLASLGVKYFKVIGEVDFS